MKILLTGEPKSGKTTLLHYLIHSKTAKRGLVALEARKDGDRIGFDLLDNSGRTAVLSRIDKKTDYPVGRYFVDLASLDHFIDPLSEYNPDHLLYIDEIGHMQLFSKKFQRLVVEYLDAENDFIGTISCVYKHPFIDQVRRRTDIWICAITPKNRDDLKVILDTALANRKQFGQLSLSQRQATLALAKEYLEMDRFISLRKLFKNAVLYVAERSVEKLDGTKFQVQGNHDNHTVHKADSTYSCDCDLFNGRHQFQDKADECSHIQAVKISSY